jgi:hypothetical protein
MIYDFNYDGEASQFLKSWSLTTFGLGKNKTPYKTTLADNGIVIVQHPETGTVYRWKISPLTRTTKTPDGGFRMEFLETIE